MRKIALVAGALLTFGVSAGSAEAQSRPGGCLKYGLGGAVAGHFAGGHRVKGAIAGCVLGMHQRRKYDREARERAQNRERTVDRRRERDWDVDPTHPRNQNPRSPYEDLGLDVDRSRPSGQASRNVERNREGFEQGGSFSRGQYESRGAPRRYLEPEETGSFIRGSGKVY